MFTIPTVKTVNYFHHSVIDFYCPELKIAVELDGEVHDNPEQKEYDKARLKYIEAFGIKFIRIKNEEFLGNPNEAFGRIEEAIKDSPLLLPESWGKNY